MEQQEIEAQNARTGVLVLVTVVFIAPLVLAVWFGAMALMLAAFDLVMAQIG